MPGLKKREGQVGVIIIPNSAVACGKVHSTIRVKQDLPGEEPFLGEAEKGRNKHHQNQLVCREMDAIQLIDIKKYLCFGIQCVA